jgi:hypothetical protein
MDFFATASGGVSQDESEFRHSICYKNQIDFFIFILPEFIARTLTMALPLAPSPQATRLVFGSLEIICLVLAIIIKDFYINLQAHRIKLIARPRLGVITPSP